MDASIGWLEIIVCSMSMSISISFLLLSLIFQVNPYFTFPENLLI